MQVSLIDLWNQMGAVAKTVAILLIGLSIVSLYLLIERLVVFSRAKSKSRFIAPKLAGMLKNGQIKEALELSSKKENRGSHLARVTAAGITEYLEGKEAKLSVEEQIGTAQRGCERASTIFTQELKRGITILATIATSAPFIGLFGTIFGIMNAFRAMAVTGSGGIGTVSSGIAEALITTAFGILVAVIALWFYNILAARIEVLGAEMSNTSSQIVDYFIRKSEERA
jgi:biopolymer transport protein ExbB/TolQ